MSCNFLLLVAVSLLSTKRYYSLTMTCVLVGFLSLHVRWTSLFDALAYVSLYLLYIPGPFASKLPPICSFLLVFFFKVIHSLWPPRSLGILLYPNFLGRSGESTSKECIRHKLNSTIAALVHLEKMYLNRQFSI